MRTEIWMLLLTSTLTLIGCRDATRSFGNNAFTRQQASEQPFLTTTINDDFAELGQSIAGFGGIYYGDGGRLTVMLHDGSISTEGREILDEYLHRMTVRSTANGPRRQATLGDVSYNPAGRFDFVSLRQWYDDIKHQLWTVRGVLTTGIRVRENSIRIGVLDSAAGAEAREIIVSGGIPVEAVRFVIENPTRFEGDLRDKVRPVPGGVQWGSSGCCATIGFTVKMPGDNYAWPYFFVNSHSTASFGTTDGTKAYQHNRSLACCSTADSNYVGYEIWDQAYFTGGICDSGLICRWSESSLFIWEDSALASFGYLARPVHWVQTFTTSGTIPILSEPGTYSRAYEGQYLSRHGAGTGSSYGQVTDTCLDHEPVPNTVVGLFCQGRFGAHSDDGDSGSPVYEQLVNEEEWEPYGVALYGIQWGGDDDADISDFSYLYQMKSEYGNFHVY